MAINVLQIYGILLKYFAAIGLFLDMVGAIIILGPDLPQLARAVTKFERHQLKRLVNRIKRGENITADERGFYYLRAAVGQGHVEGKVDRPFAWDIDSPRSFFWKFDEIEGLEEAVEIRTTDGSKSARFGYDDLNNWMEHFTGTERAYLRSGGLLLVTGFLLQFIVQLAEFSLKISFWAAMIAGITIVYLYWRFMYPISDI